MCNNTVGNPFSIYQHHSIMTQPEQQQCTDISVFETLNIFRRRWFLSRTSLSSHAISTQKDEKGIITWVEFDPPFHTHLVKSAIALISQPVSRLKRVLFVYVLELLNEDSPSANFFARASGVRRMGSPRVSSGVRLRKINPGDVSRRGDARRSEGAGPV